MDIKKFKLFESPDNITILVKSDQNKPITLGSAIKDLSFVGPKPYDEKLKTERISALLKGEEVASCTWYKEKPKLFWKSYLLSVKAKYRTIPEYQNLAILIRLLGFAINKRTTAVSEDLSKSGRAFVKKWEASGYWTCSDDDKRQTLTQFGVDEAIKYAKEFMNLNVKFNKGQDVGGKGDELITANYDADDAKPFAWSPKKDDSEVPDKLWVGKMREGHSRNCPFLKKGIDYDDLLYKGRLWFKTLDGNDLKIISFWSIYKFTDEEISFCIKELSNKTGIDFSDWSIDTGNGGWNSPTETKPVVDYVSSYKKKQFKDYDLTYTPATGDYPAYKWKSGEERIGDSLVIKKIDDFLK